MSGHSKWHNIQARKGKQDAVRSGQFTKISKLITVAAKSGGDPTMNFALRLAIEKAKSVGMPKDNIERAVKRGTGELAGEQIEEAAYEGYGPGGTAIIVKCLTDNKNRTVSDLKHIFSTHGGTMAGAGSVQWMFGQWGVVLLKLEEISNKKISFEDFELHMAEAGAEDVQIQEENIEIKTKIENLQSVLGKIREIGLEPTESGLQWRAKEMVEVGPEIEGQLSKLFEDLEENDDVEDYFTNAS
jgi:YebC/PmpR family DNA-binding regulatory protein